MASVKIEVSNLQSVLQYLGNAGEAVLRGVKLGLAEVAEEVRIKAVEYCPISPTKAQLNAARKTEGKKKSAARLKNAPGTLAQSIECRSSETEAVVFIASNSGGAAYAKYIHDQKGKKWFKRGIGTVAKGPQADEKFCTRALADSQDRIFTILKEDIEDAIAEATA